MDNKKVLLIIFVLCLFVFNLNFRTIGTTDSIPASLLPFNMLLGQGIYFDQFKELLTDVYPRLPFFREFGSHYISSYPLTSGFVSIPIYIPIFILIRVFSLDTMSNLYNYASLIEKFAGSIIASLSVVSFYLLMWLVSKEKRISLIFALIYAFATQTFSVSSQSLGQHGIANLFFILSQVHFIKWIKAGRMDKLNSSLSLFFSLLTFCSRSLFLPYFIGMLFLVYTGAKKYKTALLISSAFCLLVVISSNLYFWGSPFSGIQSTSELRIEYIPESVAGMFLSPARGLIFYTPFFVISFISILFWKKIKPEVVSGKIFMVNYVFTMIILVINSLWLTWWGGEGSWGNRLLADVAPSAVILSYFTYIHIRSILFKCLFALLIIYSVLAQSIGIFAYPNSQWDVYPAGVNENRSRARNLSDNPISRSIAVGPDINAGPRLLSWFFNNTNGYSGVKIYSGKERSCNLKMLGRYNWLGYEFIKVSLTNNSNEDWYTVGDDAGSNILFLSQVFVTHDNELVSSPLNMNSLPLVIKSKETVEVDLIKIDPDVSYKSLVITPQQYEEFWIKSCKLVLER